MPCRGTERCRGNRIGQKEYHGMEGKDGSGKVVGRKEGQEMSAQVHKVGYARSTWRKSKEFSDRMEELEEKISPELMRHYYLTGIKLPEYDEALYKEVDELFALRESGIQGEMRYVRAQARANGAEIPEEALSGKSLRIAFPELEDKAPSLGVYRLFMPLTRAELEKKYPQKPSEDSAED